MPAIKIKRKKHNLKLVASKYGKTLQKLLQKTGEEGVKIIQQEIKKRNLSENEDLVSYDVKNKKLSFTINYDSKTPNIEEKLDEKTTLQEALSPETLEKLIPGQAPEKLQRGFEKGIKKVREKFIKDVTFLIKDTISKS